MHVLILMYAYVSSYLLKMCCRSTYEQNYFQSEKDTQYAAGKAKDHFILINHIIKDAKCESYVQYFKK